MVMPTSGNISIAQLRSEFGLGGTRGLNSFYRGGVNGSVPSYGSGHNTNIPTSGTIGMSSFYGAHNGWNMVQGAYGGSGAIQMRGYNNTSQGGSSFYGNQGSLNPTNFRGRSVASFYRTRTNFKSAFYSMTITLSGSLPRSWFNRYTGGGETLYTSSARYFISGGRTTWQWTSLSGWGMFNGAGNRIQPEFIQ